MITTAQLLFLLYLLDSASAVQITIALATFLFACAGAFVSAYVGVKVALAEVRATQKSQGDEIVDVKADVRRLEDMVFLKRAQPNR